MSWNTVAEFRTYAEGLPFEVALSAESDSTIQKWLDYAHNQIVFTAGYEFPDTPTPQMKFAEAEMAIALYNTSNVSGPGGIGTNTTTTNLKKVKIGDYEEEYNSAVELKHVWYNENSHFPDVVVRFLSPHFNPAAAIANQGTLSGKTSIPLGVRLNCDC